jgi:hypothetical protein
LVTLPSARRTSSENGSARLAYGGNLKNDDADVRIALSALADVCVDYTVTYGFGAGP